MPGRYYFTAYRTEQEVILKENESRRLQENRFTRQNHRLEIQAGKNINTLSLIGGAGGEPQQYHQDAEGLSNNMLNYFAYAQAQYQTAGTLQPTAGLRYDGNTDYGGRLNFSAGAGHRPLQWLKISASFDGAEIPLNGFYHNIRNLINTEPFGIMNNGEQLFSYFNINKGVQSRAGSGFQV